MTKRTTIDEAMAEAIVAANDLSYGCGSAELSSERAVVRLELDHEGRLGVLPDTPREGRPCGRVWVTGFEWCQHGYRTADGHQRWRQLATWHPIHHHRLFPNLSVAQVLAQLDAATRREVTAVRFEYEERRVHPGDRDYPECGHELAGWVVVRTQLYRSADR